LTITPGINEIGLPLPLGEGRGEGGWKPTRNGAGTEEKRTGIG